MKTKKITLQPLLLAVAIALALPPAAQAAPGLSGGAEGYDAPPPGSRADGGPGMPPGGHGRGPRLAGPGPFGGPEGEPGPRGGPRGEPHFLRGLDLSDAQQDKVFSILHGQEPYLREQSKALHKAHAALEALGKAEKFDDAKAVALAQAAAQAMSNLALQRVRTEQKLLAVLTPEQRKQVEQRKPPQP